MKFPILRCRVSIGGNVIFTLIFLDPSTVIYRLYYSLITSKVQVTPLIVNLNRNIKNKTNTM